MLCFVIFYYFLSFHYLLQFAKYQIWQKSGLTAAPGPLPLPVSTSNYITRIMSLGKPKSSKQDGNIRFK